jgi:cephalosporin hydroxylase
VRFGRANWLRRQWTSLLQADGGRRRLRSGRPAGNPGHIRIGEMSLYSEFLRHQGRKVHKWTQYFPMYERHLGRYRNLPLTLLEIGSGEGGSAQLWKRWLGPYAQIVSVDINPACAKFEESQIAVRIGSQADPAFLNNVLAEFGRPDIIIDDGSHVMSHVVTTFRQLYLRLSPNGVYFVEDMHTAYWDEYEGGLHRPGSFIELCKHLIDELNADWSRNALPATEFTRNTTSMHFYDSAVVFERGRIPAKLSVAIGGTE